MKLDGGMCLFWPVFLRGIHMKIDDYRERIYPNYGSRFQDVDSNFDIPAARRWGRAYDYYLREWLPIEKEAAIADIACGGGRFLFFLIERGFYNIQGVDISEEQVRQVAPNVRAEDATAFLLNHAESFRLIVALDFIEHLKRDEFFQFLNAAYKALHTGGRLVLQTPNASSPFFGEMRYGDISHEICFNANSLRRLLSFQGFTDIKVRETNPIPWGYSLASSVRYLGWEIIRLLMKGWSLVEAGTTGQGILTRSLIASGQKN
jgi:2-polyprenyl-3-methyl-5-hydroxy-6-metoxy-1,4-benzoquinol methylase